ncbi:MAG: helix-turn-helix domain-containing protein [Cyanobacteria bacterium REEB67]|nr:helix-turn-helix domain-containing protein [Cyanobacteria bacterium REEB67]
MKLQERKLTLFAPEAASRAVLADLSDIRILAKLTSKMLIKNLFIEVSASMLPKVADIVKASNESRLLRALFIREDVDSKLFSQIFQRADLRLMRNILIHGANDWTLPDRVLRAWNWGAENDLIATAAVIGENLSVLTCALEQIEIPFEIIESLKMLPVLNRAHFEIDGDGSCIHWPEVDVHIDINGLRYMTDPAWRARVDLEVLTYNREFGNAIATVRKKHGLRQSDIHDLTDRQMRRIESGEAHPSVKSLNLLARAHDLSFDEYLRQIGQFLTIPTRASH